MKALLEVVAWTLLNIMGGWLIATNLLEVGRLGVATVGFLILVVAWGWLAASIVASLRRRAVLRQAERQVSADSWSLPGLLQSLMHVAGLIPVAAKRDNFSANLNADPKGQGTGGNSGYPAGEEQAFRGSGLLARYSSSHSGTGLERTSSGNPITRG